MAEYSIDNSGWLANVNVNKPLAPQMDEARKLQAEIKAQHKILLKRDCIFAVEEFNAINALVAERLAHKQQQEQEQQQRFEIEEGQSAKENTSVNTHDSYSLDIQERILRSAPKTKTANRSKSSRAHSPWKKMKR